MDRRGILLGSAGLAALSLSLSPRLALAQGTSHWLSGTQYTAMTLMAGTLAKQSSQVALERAQNPRVKQFAGFEIAEQTAVAQVLTNSDNPPPVPLDAEHGAVLKTLEAQSGPAFDRAYILGQINGHQELLQIQQGYLDNTNRSTDTQHIAVLARMSIKQHLVMLQEIQQLLVARSTGTPPRWPELLRPFGNSRGAADVRVKPGQDGMGRYGAARLVAEQSGDEAGQPGLPRAVGAGRMQHRPHRGDGRGEILVHQHMVELVPVPHLRPGGDHAAGDLVLRVLVAAAQPAFQLRQARRQQEDADHVGRHGLLQLPVALPFDVEQHVPAGGQRRFHRRARRAVGPAEEGRMFQERAGGDAIGELFRRLEEVVHPFPLAAVGGARVVALMDSDSSGSVSSRARETLVLPPPGAEADEADAAAGRLFAHPIHALLLQPWARSPRSETMGCPSNSRSAPRAFGAAGARNRRRWIAHPIHALLLAPSALRATAIGWEGTLSTFAACSFSRSIAALRSRPIRVSGTEADFDHSVFGLPHEFLGQEVQLAAGALAGIQQGAGGLDMGGEPVQALPHVGFLRQQRDLLGQPFLRDPGAAAIAEQRGEAFQQLVRCASGWPTASAAAASRRVAISASSPARITCSLVPSAWRAAARPASAAS